MCVLCETSCLVSGGGRPQMAQAGGKDPARLDDALGRAREMIRAALAGQA
ncbi:MAG TPA: hypothetical protein PLU87_18910 [Sedimentisphaerales bacterium]|nr:hypothetical protein [Sedimentisphaerales bacterium]HRV49720.1 hypothetical protein [Sedimentisphaerales bacterium]